MKNKKNIYFLIPAVLLIWGIIGFRIYSSINPTNNKTKIIVQTGKFQPKVTIKKESYILLANYRDPFLGTLSNSIRKKRMHHKVIKEKIIFPIIEYQGGFTSTSKKNTIYLIVVDGKKEMFKLKETHQKVKLLKGDKEKITMKYKSGTKTYYLKNEH